MARQLTEMQEKFLDALFGDAEGDVKLAASMAGYAPTTWNKVVAALKEEILERTEYELALNAPKAARKISSAMDTEESTAPGVNTRLAAAKEVLDRVGIAKKERLQIEGTGANSIFILPAKNPVPNDDPETNSSK